MKLDVKCPEIYRSGEFTEQFFGVGDLTVIFDILRNKIYADPIRAMVQEIMCNARDAHRETNRQNTPIEVKLPNQIEKTFYIKDYGPGITPDRMANIFIKYGMSSKRDDNTQTGGFGLGAKTPFAYTDTFTIISVTPEHHYENVKPDGTVQHCENCNVKRQYAAYIDESTLGKMACISSEITSEPTGTTISVAAKPQDFHYFTQWVEHTSRFWDVRPVVKGNPDFEWEKIEKDCEGTDWFLEKTPQYGNYGDNIMAVVDGIPYSIEMSNLGVNYTDNIYPLFKYKLRLVFKTGEIGLTAGRDAINYKNEKTKNAVRERLKNIIKDISNQLSSRISNAKSYFEAKVLWKQFYYSYSAIVKEGVWNNIKINDSDIYVNGVGCKIFRFMRNGSSFKGKNVGVLEFIDKTDIYINDSNEKQPSRLRAKTIFDNNPNIERVVIFSWPENTVDANGKIIDRRDIAEKELNKSNFDKITMKSWSSVQKAKIVRVAGTGGVQCCIKTFHPTSSYEKDTWKSAEVDIDEVEGYYVKLERNQIVIDEKVINREVLSIALQILGIKTEEVYGITKRFHEKIPDGLESIQELIENKIKEIESGPDFSIIDDEYSIRQYYPYNKLYCINRFITNTFTDKTKNEIIFDYVNKSKEMENYLTKNSSTINDYNNLRKSLGMSVFTNNKKKSKKIEEFIESWNLVEKTYPLLQHMKDTVKKTEIVDYIKMVDKNS